MPAWRQLTFSLWLVCVLALAQAAAAQAVDAEAAAQTPVKFFQAVHNADYAQAWSLLTEASKVRLAADAAEAAQLSPAEMRALFDNNDPQVRKNFWDSFRTDTKPELYVTFTYRYTGDKDGAHIVEASYPQADNGKSLDMVVKSEAGYKFGFVETYEL